MASPDSPILILGTGGTIACTSTADGSLIPTLSTQNLADAAIAHLTSQAALTTPLPPVRCDDIIRIDSSAITAAQLDEVLATIAAARASSPTPRAVILLHGTDSMEETALAADLLLPPGPPLLLTGAQRPADHPDPDGPRNIAAALRCALDPSAAGLDPDTRSAIVFGGEILPAWGAQKWHTSELRAFRTTDPDRSSTTPTAAELRRRRQDLPLPATAGLWVPIIFCHGGMDLRSLPTPEHAPDGAVIVALGSGNVPPTVADHVSAWGCPVVLTTRVPLGGVASAYGGSGGSATLLRRGWIPGGGLSPAQARIWLIAALATDPNRGRPADQPAATSDHRP